MKMITGKGRVSEKNLQWRGDNASYIAKHAWVYRRKGKAVVCESCGETARKVEWANKSQKYLRIESDWIALCVPCHRVHDGHVKFTKEEAQKIRAEYQAGGVFQRELAEKYGVSRCAIANAIKGKIKAYA